MIIQVPEKDLHIIWNEVEPLIKKALDDCCTTDDINNWLEPIQETIEKFAKHNNCNSIEVAGRKGWARKLKGYEQKIYLFSKEL